MMAEVESNSYQNKMNLRMDDEKLIEMVRQNTALFDVDHCRYADISYREQIWKEIGIELQQPPIFCKKRWGNIRDNFKKALKKMALSQEQGRTSMKKYKYSNQLEFLRRTFDDRELINVSPIEIKNELEMENNTEESDNCCLTDIKDSETDNDEEKCTQTGLSGRNRVGKRKQRKETGREFTKLMRYMMENVTRESGMVEKHPVDVFLYGIAPTLKSLSPYYLSLAKTQIYSIVQEYEMAMIMGHKTEKDQT